MRAWDRYWHEFSLERGRIITFRVLFFGLLAFDQWLMMIEHAPRYGAGEFNVAQFAFLDLLPQPNTAIVTALWLVGGFCSLSAALGIHLRGSVIGTAVCYSGVYFWSMADSYQHHYFVALLVIICCFLPPRVLAGEPDEDGRVGHWALRLIYVQVALLYGWAAIAKMDPIWLDGVTMEQLSASAEVRALMASIGKRVGVTEIYALTAVGVMLGEVFACVTYLWRRLWTPGWLVIVWFHVMIEVLDYKIEWFSYFMLAVGLTLLAPRRLVERPPLLVLAAISIATAPWTGVHVGAEWLAAHVVFVFALALVPDSVSDALGAAFRRIATPVAAALTRPVGGSVRIGLAVALAALAALAATRIPLEGVPYFATALAILALVAQLRSPTPLRAAAGQTLAIGALLASMLLTSVPYDYYRLWGGDLKRRQDYAGSAVAYEAANRIKPEGPARELQLGQVYERLGRYDDARATFEAGVARYERAIAEAARATLRATADPDVHVELAQLYEGLAERYGALQRASQESGDTANATTLRERAGQARRDAMDAYDKALSIRPDHRDALAGKRRLKRTR